MKKSNKHSHITILVLTTIFSLITPPLYGDVAGKIIAVVNDTALTDTDLKNAMASIKKNRADEAVTEEGILQEMIDNTLLKQEIDHSKVQVTDADVARAIQSILEQNHITLAHLKYELKRENISYSDYRENIRMEIRRSKFINQVIGSKVSISEQEMLAYFQEHLGEFRQTKGVELSQILLPFHAGMTEMDAKQLQQKAIKIAKEARQKPFAPLARKYSAEPFASKGGEMGEVDLSTLHPEVASTIMQMKEGEVSDPIPSPGGFQIIKLLNHKTASLEDYEEVKEQINETLYQQKMKKAIEAYIKELRQNAYIDIK